MARPPIRCAWLRELAAGYLREYEAVYAQRHGGLWGYFFQPRPHRGVKFGFFVGFVTRLRPMGCGGQARSARPLFPRLAAPECAVIAFVRPAGSPLHQRLVGRANSPFRRAYGLLTKYSSHAPRFEFYESDWAALVRHVPLASFPARQREKYARNFFMESLALLVRSGLPEELSRTGRRNV